MFHKEIKTSSNSKLPKVINGDELISYLTFIELKELNSKDFDKEFFRLLKILNTTLNKVESLKQVHPNTRKNYLKLLSILLEFYLATKIEKEIDTQIKQSLKKIGFENG